MSDLLPCLEFGAAKDEAELSVILMHGLGANGHDFADIAEAITQQVTPKKWRFVLPHAPEQPVAFQGGFRMPSWYDILSFEHPRKVDWDTVTETQKRIEALIANEAAEKLVLAGFSQGAATALHVGLRNQSRICGIISMSGYLLEDDTNPCPDVLTNLPIGIFHGEVDDVVPAAIARQAIESLEAKGYSQLTCRFYPRLPHSVFPDEVGHIFEWLNDR